MTSRVEFLSRIRGEMAKTRGLFPARTAPRPAEPRAVAETLRRELAERWPAALERFRREFERVGGVFHRVGALVDVPQVVAGISRERDVRRLVAWDAQALGGDLLSALEARGLDPVAMPPGEVPEGERARLRQVVAQADLGLTGVDLAIAETGTLVVRSLVESLGQAGVFLEAWHRAEAPGAGAVVSFITGPSRTADIELTLTRGVHGPKEVHAIFVETPIHD